MAWLQRWVRVLEAASPDDQSVDLRISAARSLQHSGLLATQHSNELDVSLAAVRLRAALVALTLLQVSTYRMTRAPCLVFLTPFFCTGNSLFHSLSGR